MDDYLESSRVHFLTYISFRKCHLSERALFLVCLIPLPLPSGYNSRTTTGHLSLLAVCPGAHQHRSTDLLLCALCHPTETTSFTTRPDNDKRCYLTVSMSVVNFLFKKPQNAVNVISNGTLQCFPYVSEYFIKEVESILLCFSSQEEKLKQMMLKRGPEHTFPSGGARIGDSQSSPIITSTPER